MNTIKRILGRTGIPGLVLVAVLSAALVSLGVLSLTVARAAPAPAHESATAPALPTAVVDLRDVDQAYVADGVVEAVLQATLTAQVSGRIVELRVRAGDPVVKGQVLARIDEREVDQSVASSQAQVARAEAEFANAKAQFERTRTLVSEKFLSPAALDKAQADYDASRAALAAARAGNGQAMTVKGYTLITAPFAGVVAERTVELGEIAQPGKPLFTVFDPRALRVVADVPQETINELRGHIGDAMAELPTLARTIKPAAITVLPSADPRTHTTEVRLDLPQGLAGLYPGMYARAQFVTGKAKKLVVPAQAVAYRSEVAGAYVIGERGDIRFRQLRLGEAAGAQGVEVLAGLAPGERVALDPVAALADLKQAGRK